DRETLVTEARRRKSGSRGGTVSVLIWGDLASRLKGRRGREPRSEESAEAVVARREASEGPNDGRAARTGDTDGPCARRPSNRWSSHWRHGVNPLMASAAAKPRRR